MRIDLNADVGEECGDDTALIPLLTSANVCCGVHAGGPETMRRTIDLCLRHGVRLGAHVSYPDREHFGRRELELPPAEISASVTAQLQALSSIARAAGTELRYLKAHGALYNRMARDDAVADAVIAALDAFGPKLPLLTLPGSVAMRRAEAAGIVAVGEVFADRGYQDDGQLQPRGMPGALLEDVDEVSSRALAWVRGGMMQSVSGRSFELEARSLCVHGDTLGAVAMAAALRTVLADAGVELKAFA
jgi:5-oxoprolinase (ATP-hydrolysing) subunit A